MTNNLPCNEPNILNSGQYKTDIFNKNPLFVVKKENLLGNEQLFLVRTWQEAFALHGKAKKEDINPKYISALISGMPRTNISPYLKIKRIPRSNILLFNNIDYKYEFKDPFNMDKIQKIDNENIKKTLLNSLKQTLKNTKKLISIEHSGGLDSNVILGSIILGLKYPAENTFTWSNYNNQELISIDKSRSFFNLVPNNCISFSPDYKKTKVSKNELFKINKKIIDILGFPSQIANKIRSLEDLKEKNCEFLFSGFGGDQALSHNALNVPTDLLNNLEIIKFVKCMPSINVCIKQLIIRSLSIRKRNLIKQFVRRKAIKGKYALKKLLVKFLTEKGKYIFLPHIIEDYPWEIDRFAFQKESIRERISADWISVRVEEESALASAFGLQKFFPLLNEEIISILLKRNPVDFGEYLGNGRMIMKKSFSDFLPSHIISQNTKFSSPIDKELILKKKNILFLNLKEVSYYKENIKHLWNVEGILDECERTLDKKNSSYMDLLIVDHTFNVLIKIAAWYTFLS